MFHRYVNIFLQLHNIIFLNLLKILTSKIATKGRWQSISDPLLRNLEFQEVASRNPLKPQGTGSVSNQPRCGCLRKLQQKMIQKLIRLAKAQPKKTARQEMDKSNLFNLVSVNTTKHIFREYKLRRCIAAKKPT